MQLNGSGETQIPLNGAGLAAKPAGTTATPDTTILSAAFNSVIDDLYAILNTARPIAYGGTGGTSVITGWDGLASKGTDIATAGSINLTTATGPSLSLTGTTTITAVTLAEGSIRLVRANAAFTITASASLLCNGSASVDMTVSAEDLLVFRGGASSVVTVSKLGASVASLTAQGVVELATVAEALTGTDAVRAVTPAGLYYPTGHLFGLTLSNNGSDATNDIDIAVGTARDGGDTANMVLPSTYTKQLDVAWAVGSAAGGLDTGAVGNSTYFIWLIKRPDTGVVDVLFSLSSTAPTMPANYTLKALIGSFARVGGVNQVPRGYSRQADLADGEFRSETPVFTQLGTVTGPNIRFRRVGDCLQGFGLFTTGTVGGGEPRISLVFNGKPVVADSAKVSAIQIAGKFARNTSSNWAYSTLVNGGNGYLNLGAGTVALAQVVTVASTYFNNAERQDFEFLVPILGWAKP